MHPYKHAAHASGRGKMSKLGGHHTKADAHERAHGGKIIVKMHHRAKHSDSKVHGMKSGGRLDKAARGAKHIHKTKVDVNLGGPMPMGATPGMTPNAGPPPGMSAGPMPAGVPGMGGLQKRGGAIHKYAKGGKVKKYEDGGDVPTPYTSDLGKGSDVEKEQYDTRTGQTTENVGMKYPKSSGDESEGLSMPSQTQTTTASAKAVPAPKKAAKQPRSSKPSGVPRTESAKADGPKNEPYSYNQMMAMHKRGGRAYAKGGHVKPEFPKEYVKKDGQSKVATMDDGAESVLSTKEQKSFLKRADGGRIRAKFPARGIDTGAGGGLARLVEAKHARKINRPA